MGIANYLIADSVIGIIAQRLVRRLCPHCKREHILTDEEMKVMEIQNVMPM